jgi:uncharacterized protein
MERLVFSLDEIPPDGLSLRLAPDPAIYGIGQVEVANPPGLFGWLKVVRDRRDLMVSGRVEAKLRLECTRCLGPAEVPVSSDFEFRMVPRSAMAGQEEMELVEGDLEIEFFDGEEVDLGHIVAEQVYLTIPMRVLCSGECRGLCPACGQDRNTVECGHGDNPADPRWSALKKPEET